MRCFTVLGPAFLATGLLAQPTSTNIDRPTLDREVVAIVLEDLATNRGKASPIASAFLPHPLTLNPTPLRYDMKPADAAKDGESKSWRALPEVDRPKRDAALRDMADRMKGSMVRFSAGSPQVRLYKGGDPNKLSPLQARPIEMTLPGYSLDGRTAVVGLSVPWSIHSCSGYYVVSCRPEGWRVDLRDMQCYP